MHMLGIQKFVMYNYQQMYDDVLPELNLLERKATPANKPTTQTIDEPYKSKIDEPKNTIAQSQSPAMRKNSMVGNADYSILPNRKDQESNRKRKPNMNNEASRILITEMLNKISLKSVSEQNYPISNETVERLMVQLEAEIKALSLEKDKFANSLLLNPSNQHLKKELQAMEKNLNQIITIKDLYKQKIDFRNKISDLESKIMELKIQNRELKIKIERGIQKIQSHIHNLPCEKEKELIEEVNKYKEALQREREMRINLESNINSINLNFKRFYQEADAARKIVAEQLSQINAKELQLKARADKMNYHRCELNHELSQTKSGTPYRRQHTNRPNEEQNVADAINMINRQDSNTLKHSFPHELMRTNTIKQPQGRLRSFTQQGQYDAAQKDTKYPVKQVQQMGTTRRGAEEERAKAQNNFNLSQQIERMRMNQVVFSKINRKKA